MRLIVGWLRIWGINLLRVGDSMCNNIYKWFIWVVKYVKKINKSNVAMGILVLVSPVVLYFILHHMEDSKPSDQKINIAEMLSGCYTFASAFLLWINFSEQRKQNEKQAIENHFYKMLEIARDNSKSMKSKGKEGCDVFKLICDDFDEVYKIIDNYFKISHANKEKPNKSDKISIS